jgi:cytochrome c oxidase subunit III
MDIPYTVSIRPDTGLYNGKLGIWLFLASEVMLFGAIFTAYLFVRIGADDGSWPNHIQNIWIGLLNTILLLTSSITMVWAWVALKERKFNTYRLALGLTILCGVAFLGLKSIEYYSKFHHYGLFIKQKAFEEKYQKDLEEAGAFSSFIPEQKLYEIRGHWENYAEKLPDNFTFIVLPDEAPTYAISFAEKKAEATAQTTGTEGAEKTISIAKSDVERSGYLLPPYGTYYAIYFLVTGLHAMHIVGGVVVMIYFLTIGAAMYRRNPEQLSNRIEVTGIFWHFVDLVWITVFPILYLT